MGKLPKAYSVTLPRVSSIVEYAFPFAGEDRERFEGWLRSKGISTLEYMKEASTGGTYVHKALENHIAGKKFTGKKYRKLVLSGIRFLQDEGFTILNTEVYFRNKYYQGTCDMVAVKDGEVWILDWKTYGLAKLKFKIPSVYKKPYSKLKKCSLQLSLYSQPLKAKRLGVVELTEDGYHFYEVEMWSKEDMKKVVKEYNLNYIDEL